MTGDDAVNPNQEPYNLDVIQADEEEVEQVPDEEETPAEVEPSAEEEPAADTDEEEDEEEEEDNSPPIQVGQQQNLAEIRKKIKKLMRS